MAQAHAERRKWLDEKFSHIDTILHTIQSMVEELKANQLRCVNRCNLEMGEIYHRLREVEHQQAAQTGAEERQKESNQSRSLTWQMIIALGTAISAVGMFIGYFIGKG
jgi:hypothetical protein